MASVHDIVTRFLMEGKDALVSGTQEASGAVSDFSEDTESATETAGDSFLSMETKVAGALGAMGAGLEGFARSMAEPNEALARLETLTGETEDSLRGLAADMSGWDTNLVPADALEGMDQLNQAGVSTIEQFEELIPLVGDFAVASGLGVDSAIDLLDRASAATGVDIEEMAEDMDMFTWATADTQTNMRNFQQAIRRAAHDGAFHDLGLDIEDVLVGMVSLEDEGVRNTQQAQRVRDAWREAIDVMEEQERVVDAGLGHELEQQVTPVEAFYEALDVGTDTLEANIDAIADAEGLTEDLAQAHIDSLTPMQRAQEQLEVLMFRYGWLADAAGFLSSVLVPLAAAVIALPAIKGAAAGAVALFGGAIAAISAPVAVAVGAVAALVAAGVWLWHNWDEVTDWIQEKIGAVWEWLTERFQFLEPMIEAAGGVFRGLWTVIQEVFGLITEVAGAFFEWLTERFTWLETPIGWVQVWLELLQETWSRIFDAIREVMDRVFERVTEIFTNFGGTIDTVIEFIQLLRENWETVISGLRGPLSRAAEGIRTIWDGIVDGIRSGINSVIESVNSLIRRVNSISISFSIPDWVPVVGGDHSIGFDISELPTLNTGGYVPGSGPDKDSVLLGGTPGEFMLNRTASDVLGPGALNYLNSLRNRRDLDRGPLATGGDVSSLQLLNSGGYVRSPNQVLAYGKANEGPYAWGGWVFPTDCSGAMAALSNYAATGSGGAGGRWATGMAGGARLGRFVRGTGNPATGFSIGVIPNRHTRGTLAGVPVESGGGTGKGMTVGSPARGVPYGRMNYFLPGYAGAPGDPSAWGDGGGAGNAFLMPFVNMILRAFTRAFGLPDQPEHNDTDWSDTTDPAFVDEAEGWRNGKVHSRRWRGLVEVGESEREITTPESLLRDTFDDRFRANQTHGDVHVHITVDGDVLDTDDWFRRHRRPMADAVGAAVASHNARNRR